MINYTTDYKGSSVCLPNICITQMVTQRHKWNMQLNSVKFKRGQKKGCGMRVEKEWHQHWPFQNAEVNRFTHSWQLHQLWHNARVLTSPLLLKPLSHPRYHNNLTLQDQIQGCSHHIQSTQQPRSSKQYQPPPMSHPNSLSLNQKQPSPSHHQIQTPLHGRSRQHHCRVPVLVFIELKRPLVSSHLLCHAPMKLWILDFSLRNIIRKRRFRNAEESWVVFPIPIIVRELWPSFSAKLQVVFLSLFPKCSCLLGLSLLLFVSLLLIKITCLMERHMILLQDLSTIPVPGWRWMTDLQAEQIITN